MAQFSEKTRELAVRGVSGAVVVALVLGALYAGGRVWAVSRTPDASMRSNAWAIRAYIRGRCSGSTNASFVKPPMVQMTIGGSSASNHVPRSRVI